MSTRDKNVQQCLGVYIPRSLWSDVKERLLQLAEKIRGKMGDIEKRDLPLWELL